MALDGQPVACHLAVRLGGAVALPKIGYDEKFARFGPGDLPAWSRCGSRRRVPTPAATLGCSSGSGKRVSVSTASVAPGERAACRSVPVL